MPVYPNPLNAALRAGSVALGMSISQLRGGAAATLAKAAGYDWLAIDREHGAASLGETGELCIAAGLCGIAPVVRGTLQTLDELTRALDGGAQGVLVARIETAAEARVVVEACRYAPTGRRSWGAGFAQMNAGPVAAAMQHAEENATVIAMIESAKGLENAGAIAAQRGIDALFVGLLDLSIDLGVPGQYQDTAVTGAFETVGRAAAGAGAAFGFGGVSDPAWERWALGLGARLLVGGSDQGFMIAGATNRARAIRDLERAPR